MPAPINDTITEQPPVYVNHYGSFEASASSSCGYEPDHPITYVDWTFWGAYSNHWYVLNHATVGYNKVHEGTLYWSCKDITCSDKEKSGQVEIVAGKKATIKVTF